MNQLFIFVLGLVLGGVICFLFLRKKPAENSNDGGQTKTGHLAGYNDERNQEHEANKQKILNFLKISGELRNNDIEKLLSVSDATATRYLEELENEGVLDQISKTGKGVYYKVK